MNNINLVDDKWIPVIQKDTGFGYASLSEIFSNGTEIVDISADTLERISLMRLLICIAEASLVFSEKVDSFKNAKDCLSELAITYLQKWKYKFNLFDEKYPFLQVRDADGEKPKSVSYLNFYEASSQTRNFINNKPCSENLSLHQIVLKLLVFQNFDTGGALGRFKWANNFTADNSQGLGGKDSICTAQNALHAFVIKSNIIETIIANLVEPVELKNGIRIDKQELGLPHWHLELTSQTTPTETITNNTKTFLGRLVPLCRAIKLLDNENIYSGCGLIYESFPDYHEFTCTFLHNDKKGESILRSNINKDIWRSLQSLLANYQTNNKHAKVPYALYSISREAFTLWVGGIATENKNILKTIESSFHIPYTGENNIRLDNAIKAYSKAVSDAEKIEILIGKAINKYKELICTCTNHKSRIGENAKPQYWSILEKHQKILMKLFDANYEIESLLKEWNQICKVSAEKSFANTCPHQTPRLLIAFMQARNELFKQPKNKNEKR